MCNVDTGGSPDNEANSPTLNLYDQLHHHHNGDLHEDDHHYHDCGDQIYICNDDIEGEPGDLTNIQVIINVGFLGHVNIN